MSEPRDEAPLPRTPAPPAERCTFCGAFTALQLGDAWVCESCYQACGSCCSEREDD